MKTHLKKIALLVCLVTLGSCDSDDDNNSTSNKTITEIAAGNANLSVLVSALQRTGLDATLDGTTKYTVFAPTDDKFNAFLQAKGFDSVDDVPEALLTEILLNHVVAGEVTSGQLSTGYVKTLAKGSASASNTLSMFVNTANGVVLNGGASNGGGTVVTEDIDAKNGVIHIVDNVLDLPTIVNHAIANPNFSILVQALTRNDQPNFVGILSGTTN
ncbi:MAG TPA: fasciclin domain-containing protein, partial [Flavobacterium sp.]|nr:fasciclin domain-containing protein [Flavobacterium sp.]